MLALLLALPGAAAADWRWSFTPYLWASEIGADVSINDHEVFETEADLADVLDSLDFVAEAHVEGQNGRHGLFFDGSYFDLGDDDRTYPLGGSRGGTLVAKGDMEMTILEAGGLFNPRGDGSGFALLYGGRMLDVDQEIDARIRYAAGSTASRRYATSSTFYDAMVGMRVLGRLSERWSFVLRADASAGGTELTWNAWTGFGWSFGAGGRYTLLMGYRYMEVEFEEEDARAEIESQLKMGGFISGMTITF